MKKLQSLQREESLAKAASSIFIPETESQRWGQRQPGEQGSLCVPVVFYLFGLSRS